MGSFAAPIETRLKGVCTLRNQSSNKRADQMLNQSIRTLIPVMAVPTIVAQLITTIYNLVDTYFVSTLGTYATAAVGVNSSLERAITMTGSLIGAGACSYIARLLGGKRKEDADRVLSTFLFIGLGLGCVLLVLGQCFSTPLVNLLGATDDCRELSIQYAFYVLFAAPFMVGQLILNMCLRSEGSAVYSMVGIGFGGVLNCFLDPLFIYVFDMGVGGASLATAISKFVSFVILLIPYLRKSTTVDLSIRHCKWNTTDTKEVLSIGSASFFRSALGVVASVLLNNVAGSISTAALAAFSISNRVMQFPFAIILGFGQGYQPVVGYNWSAKRAKRVRESFSFATMVSIVGAIVMAVILIFTAQPIVRLFNSQADASVLEIGVLCIRLESIVLPIHAWISIINMFFAGIGKARYAMILSTARQGYCYIPVVLIVPMIFGIYGLAASQAIADLLTLIPGIPLARRAYKIIGQLEQETLAESSSE